MGHRKKIRKMIRGHQRHIEAHKRKIAREASKSRPDKNLIEVWKKQIANAERQVSKLERRLER